MKKVMGSVKRVWVLLCVISAICLSSHKVSAGTTDLAMSPLSTSNSALVKPNIFFVLDDSGSMYWDYMPDWVSQYRSWPELVRNSRLNGVYYDPAAVYSPPMKYDGSAYPSMSAANTANWTRVPFDGFGVMRATDRGGSDNLWTSGWSGATQDLTGGAALYYTFVAGEYCSASNLRTCVQQSTPSKDYPYPAYLRWCSDASLSNCQASRIDNDPGTGVVYVYPRYPGQLLSATPRGPTRPGSNVKVTISSATPSYPYPGTSSKAPTRSDCAGSICSYSEEMTNFANWWAYYRTRMQMAKSASSIAMSTLTSSYRLGYMSINNNTGRDLLNVDDVSGGANGQKAAWYDKLTSAFPNGGTPLRSALATAGQYYAAKRSSINGTAARDPMQYACQRNYTLLSTDGYWNKQSADPVRLNGSLIGDQDGKEVRPYLDGKRTPNTLADVAQYYWATDLRDPSLGNSKSASGQDVSSNEYADKQQRMYTYTIGMGASGYMQYVSNYATATSGDYFDVLNGTATSGTTLSKGICSWQRDGSCNWPVPYGDTQTAIDDLWHAAVNGRGTYYSATNAGELKAGLTNFLQSVDAATGSATAPTLSSANFSSAGGNAVFGTTFCGTKWFGELARFTVDPATGELSSVASWSQSGLNNDCGTSSGSTPTPALLDKQSPATRNIFTWDPKSRSNLPFKWDSLPSSVQGYFKLAHIRDNASVLYPPLSQLCVSGSNCLSAAAQIDSGGSSALGAGGMNLVNFLRGERGNEGVGTSSYFFARTHVLGDIVNSQAVYIQSPNFVYKDAGYSAFKSDKASRQGMVYVGANDGMIHAFNADSGAEVWAFIPTTLLPDLYRLADKNYAANHRPYVDGPIAQADVYFDGGWHTVLVGGLGGGGRGIFALDVTDPNNPSVLWEFTHDTSKASPYVVDEDVGYSYGRPVVTKLSDGTWAVLVSSGYNNVNPGSGEGAVWVLNAKTGGIIKKMSTGVGSSAATAKVAGCASGPCPSGLAKFSAWVDAASDNTAKQVYGGDLYGNLWRFDISKLTGSGGVASVQLLATLEDSEGARQPVTSRPELGLVGDAHMVYVGTGAYLGVSDIASTQLQSIYAIKDSMATTTASSGLYGSPRTNNCTATTTANCFMRQVLSDNASTRSVASSVAYATIPSNTSGWYADLPRTGERVNTDPVLQLGTLAYVSNVPTTDACSAGGSSYINYVNYSTGLTVTGAVKAGELLSSSALSSAAVLARTTRGKTIAITKQSDGKMKKSDLPSAAATFPIRRIWWRRLADDR